MTAPSIDDPDDAAALAAHAVRLAEAIEGSLPVWVERSVAVRWEQWTAHPVPEHVAVAARAAGARALADIGPALRRLLATDVGEQRTNPLAVLRGAVVHATAVLAAAGVPPVERDEQAVRLFPDDAYDLVPASFADIDPALHEPGLVWGAAKAHVILRRRRP